MSNKIYYDAPHPIEYLSSMNIARHKQNCPQLAAASIEELTLTPNQKAVKVTEEDGTTKQYQITPVIYPPEFITELEINDELRVRLDQTRNEHKKFSDMATDKILSLQSRKDQWKNSAIATRRALVKTKQELATTKHDLGFKQHVINRRNQELTQKKAQIRKFRHDIGFKQHVIKRRNEEITEQKKQMKQLKQDVQFKEHVINRRNQEIAQKEKTMAEQKKTIAELEEQVKTLTEKIEELTDDNDTLTGLLEIWMPKTEEK